MPSLCSSSLHQLAFNSERERLEAALEQERASAGCDGADETSYDISASDAAGNVDCRSIQHASLYARLSTSSSLPFFNSWPGEQHGQLRITTSDLEG